MINERSMVSGSNMSSSLCSCRSVSGSAGAIVAVPGRVREILAHPGVRHCRTQFGSYTKPNIIGLFLSVLMLWAAGGWAGEVLSEGGYARLVERELSGEVAPVLAEYRALLDRVPQAKPELAQKLLYRIGICEKRLGHSELARQAWRRLIDSSATGDSRAEQARTALKQLEHELDRVVMTGRIIDAPDNYATRQPDNFFIMAGEWGNEPLAMSDSNGVFKLERRQAGRLKDGRRYGYVLVEHPVVARVGGGVWMEGVEAPVIQLQDALMVTGRVTDANGNAVPGALIRVMGYSLAGTEEISLPFDNLLPPQFSGTNGEFRVTGLIPGCRYVFTAEKPGFRLVSSMEINGSVLSPLSAIILKPLGEISLGGRVVDQSGEAVQARVSAWTLPPGEHELARVEADQDGQFVFRDLGGALVVLKVDSEGCIPRSLPGLKPMGQEIDVVVRRSAEQGAGSKEQGARSGERGGRTPDFFNNLTTRQLNNRLSSLHWLRGNPETGEGVREEDLKGHVVVIHYGSAYVEASLRSQYPGETGVLSRLLKIYGDQGLVILWVLPEEEGKGEASRMAMELYPDLPVGSGEWGRGAGSAELGAGSGERGARSAELGAGSAEDGVGNLVLGRDGRGRSFCSDQQLFKVVKHELRVRGERGDKGGD